MELSLDSPLAQYNGSRVSWVNEPNGRGTLSILVSCLSSLFLSSWAVMHLNIPAKRTSTLRRLSSYLYWCIFGIFGPELVIWAAWRQLLSAWALRDELRKVPRQDSNISRHLAITDCSQIMDSDWTITHGFYTLMGGFVIDTYDSTKQTNADYANGISRLSLTPKGMLLLAKCNHLPRIPKEDILDKSKTDELGKMMACAQVTWIVIQVCARLGLRLPVTILEVTTVSHVICALVLYALWWYKPRKVKEPTVLSGDWVQPLAAFMLMCSPESEGQTLPGFRLDDEHSEIACLRLMRSGAAGVEASDAYSFMYKRDGIGTSRLPPQESELVCSATTHARWRLARDAIASYSAVRDIFRCPLDEQGQKYALALQAYPEMPSRCRRENFAEKGTGTAASWLECDTQHLVVASASNWPHDGLLRTTSGLWIGACLWLVSIIYSGIHIAAWEAAFPTKIEAWLWRGAAMYVAFSGLLWASVHVLAQFSARLWWAWYDVMSGDSSRWVSWSIKISCAICGLAYVLARANLIVEAFISLRLLPAAAYITPEWTLGVPHVA